MGALKKLGVVLLSIGLLACSDSNDDFQLEPPPPSEPVLEKIRVEPIKTMFPVGTTQQYTATGIYSDGSRADLTPSASWEITEPDIASVDDAGLVTGLTAGDTDVIASQDGVRGSAWLSIIEPEVVSVGIYPPAPLLSWAAGG